MRQKASPAISNIVIYFLEERILAKAGSNMYKCLRFRDDVYKQRRAALFKEKLLPRGYSYFEFEQAFSQVDHNLRQTYLREKGKKNVKDTPLVFTTTYNPSPGLLHSSDTQLEIY